MVLPRSFFHLCLLTLSYQFRHIGCFSADTTPSRAASASLAKQTGKKTFQYTHLEVNGMLWSNDNFSLVIDPIASELNFGIPWGYRANKKFLDEQSTLDLIARSRPSHCLLSQGLDDHTHLATLAKVLKRLPSLQFLVAPSAYDKVSSLVSDRSNIAVMNPGQSVDISSGVTLRATEGALVGPPWQARENGWLLKCNDGPEVYMEPHADVRDQALQGLHADIVISPIKEQALPAQVPKPGQFKLVYGGVRTLQIAQALNASVVIPLGNGELDTTGPLAALVASSGSLEEFEQLVARAGVDIHVERPSPGVPLVVQG